LKEVMVRRVLFVAYEFPPVGGAGVQRTTKFVKYLPEQGWLPSVLTVANPSVPVMDESLCDEIPQEVTVLRAKTWEPGYAMKSAVGGGTNQQTKSSFTKNLIKKQIRGVANLLLQPDPQILWAPHAVRAGSRLLREIPHDAVYATGPPFSSFLIGFRLSQKFNLPLILDYRDEWELSNDHRENRNYSAIARAWQRRMQAKLLRGAMAAVATTEQSAESIRGFGRKHGCSTDVHCIYNGFDPEDFEEEPVVSNPLPEQTFRLCYVGTLWNLTSIRPLVEAIKILCARDPEKASRLELVIAGRRTSEQERILRELELLPCTVRSLSYVSHGEAIRLMKSSHELVLLLADTPDAARVVPAKIFEYMAAKRTILAISPAGEISELLSNYPSANCFSPSAISNVADHLAAGICDLQIGGSAIHPESEMLKYSRPVQAGQLANILNSSLGVRGLPGPDKLLVHSATQE
jgi:hypothetical protein